MKIAGKRYWMWFSVWALAFFGWGAGSTKAIAQGTTSSTIVSPRDPQLSKDKDHKVNTHKVPILNDYTRHKRTYDKSHAKHDAGGKLNTGAVGGDDTPTESIRKADTPGGVGGHKVTSRPHKVPSPKTPK
jgi:hypothetical protein